MIFTFKNCDHQEYPYLKEKLLFLMFYVLLFCLIYSQKTELMIINDKQRINFIKEKSNDQNQIIVIKTNSIDKSGGKNQPHTFFLKIYWIELNEENLRTLYICRIPNFGNADVSFLFENNLFFINEIQAYSHGIRSYFVRFDIRSGRRLFEKFLSARILGLSDGFFFGLSQDRKELIAYNTWPMNPYVIKLFNLKTWKTRKIYSETFPLKFALSKKGFVSNFQLTNLMFYPRTFSENFPLSWDLFIGKLDNREPYKIKKQFVIKNNIMYIPQISIRPSTVVPTKGYKREDKLIVAGSPEIPHKTFSPSGEEMAFVGCLEFPLSVNVYYVNLESGNVKMLLQLNDFSGKANPEIEWSKRGIVVTCKDKIFTNYNGIANKLKKIQSINMRKVRMAFCLDLLMSQQITPIFSVFTLCNELSKRTNNMNNGFVEIKIPGDIHSLKSGKISADGTNLMLFGIKNNKIYLFVINLKTGSTIEKDMGSGSIDDIQGAWVNPGGISILKNGD